MTTAIEIIRIGEDEIQGIRDEQGGAWVVVRRLCDVLGLDPNGQQQRLRDAERAPWATTCALHAVAEDGKNREVFCLHADSVPMWLATVNASQCAEREKVVRFQREAAKVLADWAYGRRSEPSAALDVRTMAQLARSVLALTEQVEAKDQAIAELTPPATAWRELADCRGDVNLQTAGKALGLPPNLWIAWLRQQGHLFYRGRNLVASQAHLDAGHFTQRVRVRDGEEFIQTLVTPKGIAYWGERRPVLRQPRRARVHLPALPEH